MNEKIKSMLKLAVPIIIAILSMFVLSKLAASPEFHSKTIASLDAKKESVTALAAAATATSVGISAIPGDAATPLATELADLSSYFMIVLAAIYLEKYLVTITGYLSFKWLIPVACGLFVVNIYAKSQTCRNLIRKIVIVALVMVAIIPASEKISGLIDDTYKESIQQTIAAATDTVEITEDEEGGLSAIWNKVTDVATEAADSVKNTLNSFIEALAMMIVTSCVIPILVLMFFIWFIKFIIGINVNLPKMENLRFMRKGVQKIHSKANGAGKKIEGGNE